MHYLPRTAGLSKATVPGLVGLYYTDAMEGVPLCVCSEVKNIKWGAASEIFLIFFPYKGCRETANQHTQSTGDLSFKAGREKIYISKKIFTLSICKIL